MKAVFGNRSLIYKILSACFASQAKAPEIIEVGVFNGKNAKNLYDELKPSKMVLVDSWSSAVAVDDYRFTNRHRPWVQDPIEFSTYFGGAIDDQSTFDRLYESTRTLFSMNANVEIIRSNSSVAAEILKSTGSNFDLIYVDANHQFEQVFDDLVLYSQVLNQDGFLQLNDCCHSGEGIRQNLGVLEATVKFCKMFEFRPILLTNTDWTDVVLARKNSSNIEIVENVVANSAVSYIELPDQLLGALTVKYGKVNNLSFV